MRYEDLTIIEVIKLNEKAKKIYKKDFLLLLKSAHTHEIYLNLDELEDMRNRIDLMIENQK